MENVNQDAMMHSYPQSFAADTGGPMQIPDQADMPDDDANGDPTGTPDRLESTNTGAASGSPNMEPDSGTQGGTDESIGNNDGTEISPESTDEEFLK